MKVVKLLCVVCFCLVSISIVRPVWSEDTPGSLPVIEEKEGQENVDASSKARIEVTNTEFDFGAVKSSEQKNISHNFVFRNSGEEDLIIREVKPSCGCTAAVASATQVVPGATASLAVSLNPKGKFGRQNLTVRLITNDPKSSTTSFRMTGTLLSGWRVLPVFVEMGALGKNQAATREVIVTSQYMPGDPMHKITHLKTSSPEITAVTVESPAVPVSPPQNQSYIEVRRTVRIAVNVAEKMGEFNQTVQVATDDPESPTHVINVHWSVEGDIETQPKKIFITEVNGKKNTRDFILTSRTGKEFSIVSCTVKGNKGTDDIEVTEKPESTKTRHVFTSSTKFVPEKVYETRSGMVIFKTDLPDQPEVSVPYTATVRKPK